MDDETRAAFGRMERWFELSQAQHLEFRAEMKTDLTELRGEVAELRIDLNELRGEVAELRSECRSFRDWTTAAIVEIRTQLQ